MIYLELFLVFLKIGAFTFGGGFAMLPLVQEAVLKKGWIAEETIVDFIAVSESTPGPFAVNIATFVGAETGGILGAFVATLGVVLPSFIIILIVARFYDKYRNSSLVKGIMTGLKPAVVGLIAGAILSVGTGIFFPEGLNIEPLLSGSFYLSAVIFLVMLVLALKKVHPIVLILLSAAAGIVIGYLGIW